MMSLRASWLLLLLTACVKQPAQYAKGAEPARTTAAELADALEPRRLAVLIGVDQYDDPNFEPLKYAATDADALAARLSSGPTAFDSVVVLGEDGRSTRAQVLAALRDLSNGLRREDTVVVYFSGHGTELWDGAVWRRFLLTSDTFSGDLESTAVEFTAVQDWFAGLTPARKTLIVDACFSGDGKSVVRPKDREDAPVGPPTPLTPRLTLLGPGESHLYATTAGRPARESDELGHGVYTYYLLDALSWSVSAADLNQDGAITSYEAHDYARARAMEFTDGVQIPEAALRVVGEADVVLGGSATGPADPDNAMLYLYSASNSRLEHATVAIDGRNRGTLPGTVLVAPGKRHLAIRDDEGTFVEGFVRLAPGARYRADDVVRRVQGPRGGVGLRAAFIAGSPPPMRDRPIAAGGELWLMAGSSQGPTKGAFLGLGLAAGTQTGEDAVGRPATWYTPELGYQRSVGPVRLAAGAASTLLILPPDRMAASEADQLGWWFLGLGPTAGCTVDLGRGWGIGVRARPQLTWLDLDLDGRTTTYFLGAGSLGMEVTF